MKMKKLLALRKALKNPKSVQKLINEIEKEIEINDQVYQARDKELKDLLKIISSSQGIINAEIEN